MIKLLFLLFFIYTGTVYGNLRKQVNLEILPYLSNDFVGIELITVRPGKNSPLQKFGHNALRLIKRDGSWKDDIVISFNFESDKVNPYVSSFQSIFGTQELVISAEFFDDFTLRTLLIDNRDYYRSPIQLNRTKISSLVDIITTYIRNDSTNKNYSLLGNNCASSIVELFIEGLKSFEDTSSIKNFITPEHNRVFTGSVNKVQVPNINVKDVSRHLQSSITTHIECLKNEDYLNCFKSKIKDYSKAFVVLKDLRVHFPRKHFDQIMRDIKEYYRNKSGCEIYNTCKESHILYEECHNHICYDQQLSYIKSHYSQRDFNQSVFLTYRTNSDIVANYVEIVEEKYFLELKNNFDIRVDRIQDTVKFCNSEYPCVNSSYRKLHITNDLKDNIIADNVDTYDFIFGSNNLKVLKIKQ